MLVQLLLLVTISLVEAHPDLFRVIYQWNLIEPKWPNQEAREASLKNGSYIPENNAITGIQLWKNNLYLTVPRWLNGVPVSLYVTSATPEQIPVKTEHGVQYLNVVNPKLKPFPNWEMQKIGDCNAFQFVHNIAIDPLGRMWVIDSGRTETHTDKPKTLCPPKLVIIDLERGGIVLKSYIFPTNVVDHQSGVLNNIVLDHEHGGFAYITDSGDRDPGLVVYSLASNTSWKVRDKTMRAEDEAKQFTVNKVSRHFNVNINGIALSPASGNDRLVYYTPLSSFNLYSIPTAVLQTGVRGDVKSFIRKMGRRVSQTDGMVMSSTGLLFFGLLGNNSMAYWTRSQVLGKQSQQDPRVRVAKDDELLQWPQNYGMDEEGYLWCVTNSLQNFGLKSFNPNATNYRVVKIVRRIARNYQYYENGTAPFFPIVSPLESMKTKSEYENPASPSTGGDSLPVNDISY